MMGLAPVLLRESVAAKAIASYFAKQGYEPCKPCREFLLPAGTEAREKQQPEAIRERNRECSVRSINAGLRIRITPRSHDRRTCS
jgi:hypothetical protein